jgi:hypothetical protein
MSVEVLAVIASIRNFDPHKEYAVNHVGVVVALHLIEEIFDCEFEHADTISRVIACMRNHLEDVIGVTIVRLNLPVLKSLLDLNQSFAGQVPCALSLLADQVNRLVV